MLQYAHATQLLQLNALVHVKTGLQHIPCKMLALINHNDSKRNHKKSAKCKTGIEM